MEMELEGNATEASALPGNESWDESDRCDRYLGDDEGLFASLEVRR